MNDVKAIKTQVSKIENIEKTMNQMCGKIKNLEVNVGNIDKRLSTVETSCLFVGSQYDDHKRELESAKRELKKMKTTCMAWRKILILFRSINRPSNLN